MNKNSLFHLSIFTLFGFSMIAFILLHFTDKFDYWEMLSFVYFTPKAIGIGLLSGVVAALLGLLLIKLLPDGGLDALMNEVMKNLNPKWYHILFYSFCAGVGEEILFRGAVQHYIYLWPTSILFVAIHGYLNFKDRTMFTYGVFLVFVAGGFGYLFKFLGIYAAIAAHFIYDVIMFYYMKKELT